MNVNDKYRKIIVTAKKRIGHFETKRENYSIDVLRNTKRFDTTLNMKYAAAAMKSQNKINSCTKMIEKYKEMIKSYEKRIDENV